MECAGLVLDALGRVRDMVGENLKDLSPEELFAPPKPHIAWLGWHIPRVQRCEFFGLDGMPAIMDFGRMACALQYGAGFEGLRLRSQAHSSAS